MLTIYLFIVDSKGFNENEKDEEEEKSDQANGPQTNNPSVQVTVVTDQRDTGNIPRVRRNDSSESDVGQDTRRRRPNMDSEALF